MENENGFFSLVLGPGGDTRCLWPYGGSSVPVGDWAPKRKATRVARVTLPRVGGWGQ